MTLALNTARLAGLDPEKRHYLLAALPGHLERAGRRDALRDLLTDAGWLRAKLDALSIDELLADHELLADPDEAAVLVRQALELARPVLAVDRGQLRAQLFGRLLGSADLRIAQLLAELAAADAGPWLRPVFAAMDRPDGPLIATLSGHTDRVHHVAVSSDGRLAVSASADRTVVLWDLQALRRRQTFVGHGDEVNVALITPDGSRVISGSGKRKPFKAWNLPPAVLARFAPRDSADSTIRIWNAETGAELERHACSAAVRALYLTPNPRAVNSGHDDGQLQVLDFEEGPIGALWQQAGPLTIIAASRGHLVGCSETDLVVWPFEAPALAVGAFDALWQSPIAVRPDRLVVALQDSTIDGMMFPLVLWDLEAVAHPGAPFTIRDKLPDGSAAARRIATFDESFNTGLFVAGGARLVLGMRDGQIQQVDCATGEPRWIATGHRGEVTSLAVTADGARLVSASDDGTLKVWDLARLERDAAPPDSTIVAALAAFGDGVHVVSAGEHGPVVWDARRGAVVRRIDLPADGPPQPTRAIAVGASDHRLTSCIAGGRIVVTDLDDPPRSRTVAGTAAMQSVSAWALAAHGAIVAAQEGENQIAVWDLRGEHRRAAFRVAGAAITAIALSPDGSALCCGHEDGQVTLLGTSGLTRAVLQPPDPVREAEREPPLLLTGPRMIAREHRAPRIRCIAFGPDGARVAAASEHDAIAIWEVDTGRPVARCTGHTRHINGVAFTLDGAHLVSASNDGTVQVWDVRTGRSLAAFSADGALSCCAVLPDGTIAAGRQWQRSGIVCLALERMPSTP